MEKAALILRNRSAFAKYVANGIYYVRENYPDSLDFVLQRQHLDLNEVTKPLAAQLDDLRDSNNRPMY